MSNNNLINAKKAKNDEFYTQLSDIEKELSHYPIETFKDKVVYCPCDSTDYSNGYISNFAIYFYKNFKSLGLKKLICTCYSDGINYYEYNGINEFESHRGSGDFRSEYCTRLLQEADIVVTNPPFSLFREFVKWLVNANKKFIILGNKASTTYADIFTLFRDGKCRLGYSIHSGERYFIQPDTDELSKGISVRWFTNLFYSNTVDKLILLSKEENEERNIVYSKLDNYDAINVNKYKDIPSDFTGIMAVPVSFFDYWCPEQFELLGLTNSSPDLCYCKISEESDTRAKINGKPIYARVLIRHRKDKNDLSSDT